jgi:hypothetical protein
MIVYASAVYVSDIENSLQKHSMSSSDSLNSLRLALSFYEYT